MQHKDVDNKKIKKEWKEYLPKFIRMYFEKKYFTKEWKSHSEWVFCDTMLHDKFVGGYGNLVGVVLYNGKRAEDFGIFGEMFGHKSCNAAEVIWSKKTIEVTTDAMWEENKFEVTDISMTKEELDAYFTV